MSVNAKKKKGGIASERSTFRSRRDADGRHACPHGPPLTEHDVAANLRQSLFHQTAYPTTLSAVASSSRSARVRPSSRPGAGVNSCPKPSLGDLIRSAPNARKEHAITVRARELSPAAATGARHRRIFGEVGRVGKRRFPAIGDEGTERKAEVLPCLVDRPPTTSQSFSTDERAWVPTWELMRRSAVFRNIVRFVTSCR